MALIKPELTERDGGITRKRGKREGAVSKTNRPINRNSRSVHGVQIKRFKVSDLLTTAICLCCVTFKQELCVH